MCWVIQQHIHSRCFLVVPSLSDQRKLKYNAFELKRGLDQRLYSKRFAAGARHSSLPF